MKPLTVAQARTIADKAAIHSRGCKRQLSDCVVCSAHVEWFGSLPLPLLSQVLEERPKQ